MYKEVIYLINTLEKVISGDTVLTKSEREVYADIKSIGMSEFYQAQAVGLKPEIKFILADYEDYQNEKTVKYNDIEYSILRTYRDGRKLEITCKGDVNAST
jgi:SPP1 family predicted phage head-tail adaptor